MAETSGDFLPKWHNGNLFPQVFTTTIISERPLPDVSIFNCPSYGLQRPSHAAVLTVVRDIAPNYGMTFRSVREELSDLGYIEHFCQFMAEDIGFHFNRATFAEALSYQASILEYEVPVMNSPIGGMRLGRLLSAAPVVTAISVDVLDPNIQRCILHLAVVGSYIVGIHVASAVGEGLHDHIVRFISETSIQSRLHSPIKKPRSRGTKLKKSLNKD